MELHFPLVPARLRVQSCPSSVAPGCFWLVVVVVLIHHLAAIYSRGVVLFMMFSDYQFDKPNSWITSHHNLIVQRIIAPSYSLQPIADT